MRTARAGMLAAIGMLASIFSGAGPTPGYADQSPDARQLRRQRRGSNRSGPAHVIAARLAAAQAKRDRKAARRLREAQS